MVVDRTTFDQVLGRRNPEVMRIFDELDTDADGKVDTFEVLLTLILWSCAPWDEKLELLFRCFDFNCKGSLRLPELVLLAATATRVVARFAEVPGGAGDFRTLREETSAAYGSTQGGELHQQAFAQWFETSALAQQLKSFIDQSLGDEAPEAVEALVRERLRMLEYRSQELLQAIEELNEAAQGLKAEAKAKPADAKCDELWRSFDAMHARLTTAAESQRGELAELTASLSQISEQGPAALLEPSTRARHSHFIKEITALEQHARQYLTEAKQTLGQLIEIIRGPDNRPETPVTALPPLPRPPDASADPAAATRNLRLLDRELRRLKIRQPVEASGISDVYAAAAPLNPGVQQPVLAAAGGVANGVGPSAPTATVAAAGAAAASASSGGGGGSGEGGDAGAEAETEEAMPMVVAFAAFEPPESSETQMLTLQPGDEILALGQDGQGWWYGRKTDGSEGWFPPSYVQLKEEQPSATAPP